MSEPMKKTDPAYFLLEQGVNDPSKRSHPDEGVHDPSCYICRDPEFSLMGLPLCKSCPNCKENNGSPGHVPADDVECTVCGFDVYEHFVRLKQRDKTNGPD